jgi:hypothetical protein
VTVGKAKVSERPARYHVEVVLRTAPSLAPQTRRPYVGRAPGQGARWYAGDFHVHSREAATRGPRWTRSAPRARHRA